MLKKLLNLFDIAKEEEAKNSSQHASSIVTNHSKDDDDHGDDHGDDNEDDNEDEWAEEEKGQRVAVELDPETLHGTNYTEAEFDEEVEKRVQAHIANDKADGEDVLQEDIDNYYFNIRRKVYQEWTGANSNLKTYYIVHQMV